MFLAFDAIILFGVVYYFMNGGLTLPIMPALNQAVITGNDGVPTISNLVYYILGNYGTILIVSIVAFFVLNLTGIFGRRHYI